MQERLENPLLPESQMVFPSDTDVNFREGCVRQPGWIAMENLGDEAYFMPALSDGGISLAILTGGMIFRIWLQKMANSGTWFLEYVIIFVCLLEFGIK